LELTRSVKETREIERFDARSNNGEYETTIIVYQDFIDAGTMQDPNAVVLGMKEARTPDGYGVNVKGDDEHEIVNDPLHPAMIVQKIR
jgi:hypothetical protein